MNEKMLTLAIKPFLPQIKSKAGESIKNLFVGLIAKAETQLKDGESYAAMMAVKTPNNEIYLLTCAMSSDDHILRTINSNKADEFTNQLLEKIL